jgi:DNA ligase 1
LPRLSTPPPEVRRAASSPPGTAGRAERFLFTKLLTGGFRVGISQTLMTRALAQATGQEEPRSPTA